MEKEAKLLNGSVTKAFQLLDFFTPTRPAWGVRELAKETGTNKSTTYRMLATLVGLGVLRQETDTDKYRLGLKLFELGNRVDIQNALLVHTHPIVQQVAAEITETVHLGMLHNHHVLIVDQADGSKSLQLQGSTGQLQPIHCTSMGKLLLAYLAEAKQQTLLENITLDSATEHTIIHQGRFKDALQQIHAQGYALDREEWEIGLICLAVPVYNDQQEVIAALSAAGPANRFQEDSLPDYLKTLRHGASKIQQAIGNYTQNITLKP